MRNEEKVFKISESDAVEVEELFVLKRLDWSLRQKQAHSQTMQNCANYATTAKLTNRTNNPKGYK